VRHVTRCLRLAGVPASSRCISIGIAIVKVDQSFITGLADDPIDQASVTAIIGLGHALDVEVVAEGIETPEDPWALVALGALGPRGSSLGARCQPTTSTPSSCRGHRSQLHRGLPAGELAAGRRALTTPVPVPASYEASLRGRFALSRISVGTPKSRNAS